jgi:Co/Zn/Cd efflux system component
MTDCDADHPESGAHQHEHPGLADEHGHSVTASSDSRYIAIALGLIVCFLVFEVVMAFAGHSLALLADAGHMLTDAGALGASLVAIRLARRPASGVWTFGFKRAEVLSAQANGITLLVISALVAFEAISRLIHPLPVTGGIVVAVAAAGVAVNVAATWAMARANRDSINVRGAFAHVVTDLYGFIGTLVAGIVIIVTGFERADSIASLIVSLEIKALNVQAPRAVRGFHHAVVQFSIDEFVAQEGFRPFRIGSGEGQVTCLPVVFHSAPSVRHRQPCVSTDQ